MTTKNLTVVAPVCAATDCSNPVCYRKLCSKHYNRAIKTGEIKKVKFENFVDSFFAKTEKGKNQNDCWKWLGYKNKTGYGRMKCNGKNELSHRVSFFIKKGFWAKGMVLHSCDNPECCNPKHLRQGTAQENAQDCIKRGRKPYPFWLLKPRIAKPQKKILAELTSDEIKQIEESVSKGHIKKYIAERFNISMQLINQIAKTLNF